MYGVVKWIWKVLNYSFGLAWPFTFYLHIVDHHRIIKVATRIITQEITTMIVVPVVKVGTMIVVVTNNQVGIVASLAPNITAKIVMNPVPGPVILINPLRRVFNNRGKRIRMPHLRWTN